MKTFDLFNTLATSRFGLDAGEVPIECHIPIAENIAKVRPGDLVVSDYYDTGKAQRILREICQLGNVLICTENGKETGAVWGGLGSEGHLGDNHFTDCISPKKFGILAQLTGLFRLTPEETKFKAGRVGDARGKAYNAQRRTRAPCP